ncbi:MAG: hypothetical protein ACFFDT_39145 [Candidatus Hodarchaeota archaeon]
MNYWKSYITDNENKDTVLEERMMSRLFKRKQKDEEEKVEEVQIEDKLKEIVGDREDLYNVLNYTIFPFSDMQIRRLGPIKMIIDEAKKLENEGRINPAIVRYETLARIAVHKSELQQAEEYYKKCSSLAKGHPNAERYEYILAHLEEVVDYAQKYKKATSES